MPKAELAQTRPMRLRLLALCCVAVPVAIAALTGSPAAAVEPDLECSNGRTRMDHATRTVLAPMAGQIHRSDVDGRLLLIDPHGFFRGVPEEAFNSLFRDDAVISTLRGDLRRLPQCTALPAGAIMLRGQGTSGVYLVADEVRYGIASPAVMDKYGFAWEKVLEAPAPVLALFPEGPTWR